MKNRLYYLDNAKTVGIIGVIFGHVFGFGNIISVWFLSFHVPLFFIISGILVSKKSECITEILKKNIRNLIVPYYFFSIPFIIYEIYKTGIGSLKTSILKVLSGYGMGALWFLTALFWGLLFFRILLSKLGDHLPYIVSIIIFVIPFFIKTDNIIGIVILRACTAEGFVAFGHFVVRWVNKGNYIVSVILLIINLVATGFNGPVDLYDLNYGKPILYAIQGITGSLAIILLFKNMNLRKDTIFSCIGSNTLILMATHQIVLIVVKQLVSTKILVFLLTLLVEIPLVYMFNKYFPFVVGKFKKSVV